LLRDVRAGLIAAEDALAVANHPETFRRSLAELPRED
jgi:hypothetical protein